MYCFIFLKLLFVGQQGQLTVSVVFNQNELKWTKRLSVIFRCRLHCMWAAFEYLKLSDFKTVNLNFLIKCTHISYACAFQWNRSWLILKVFWQIHVVCRNVMFSVNLSSGGSCHIASWDRTPSPSSQDLSNLLPMFCMPLYL